ncbi:sucrase ferredoxin [Komarekiella sp. 'clone 1']|uniref:Sucrase ferredoxin n=1 Tax=Komarekiella delphini-convector SJRDD-AB1 TaxID=2593771 RepID=A0AA40VS40_9NOST|nr:sucrase ferredoxin [Komarekiella delphini-convector]MBD6617804.1 sucrase ferredoxin [Komarekiella delphini-convector SJRDD-AB1]
MSINKTQNHCRFCSQISQANGEDPIGSAIAVEQYLIIEATQPWPILIWIEPNPMPQEVIDALNFVWEGGGTIRQLAIAPDKEYSIPGHKHVFYYRRPGELFAEYEKQAFLVPDGEVGALALALIKEPASLPDFEQYRQKSSHIRELLICTHGNVDAACSRFGYPIYKKLRFEYAATNANLRVWRCSHFGGHQFAPTLVDLPLGHYWGHLQPEILDVLVWRKGSVKELYPYYRGWGGLSKLEQVVEREIWMQKGWNWLQYPKSGQILTQDKIHQEWANIRIDFTAIDCSRTGTYQAKVEVSGYVMTAFSSRQNESLKQIKQYHVSYLAAVE